MSTALATVSDKNLSIDKRVSTLRDLMQKNAAKLTAAAAGAVSGERLIQMACNSIRRNPKLLDCSVPSIFGALSEAASYGWSVDGVLGHAYLVPFRNEAVLVPGYKGLRDLINRSGKCTVTIESVHEGDEYVYRGKFELPTHGYSNNAARRFSPVTHAYVVADFGLGRIRCFSWTVGECLAHRDHFSQNWKNHKSKDSPWHEENPSFRVMCMKTVLLDAVHRGEFPLSLEDKAMAERAESAERRSVVVEAEGVDLLEEDNTVPVAEAVANLESPKAEVLTGELSDTEKARVAVEEALPECKSLSAINKVLTKWQGVLTSPEDKEWLVARCDARAQEVEKK